MTPTQTADITSILPGLAEGERAAVAAAYGGYGGPVTTIAYGVLGDGDLAGRAVLSTFYRIAEATPELVGGVDPTALIYAMARSEVTDLWQAEIEHRRATGGTVATDSLGAIPLDATGSAWDVRRAIDQLDEDEQTLLKLVHFAQMQPSAIIEHLGVTVDELKTLSKRAHRELATTLSTIESGEDHSLDHVTSLLCSDAMWTDTSDPMIDSIIAVIAAGPEALGPRPSAEPATPAPSSKPSTASSATVLTAGAAAAAGKVASKSDDAKNSAVADAAEADAAAGVVRINPVDDDARSNADVATSMRTIQLDEQPTSRTPAVDLPWKKSDESAADVPAGRGNGTGVADPQVDKSSERSPLAIVAPLRPTDDERPDLSQPRSAATDTAARKAHLPLPDPVSAQTDAIQESLVGDGNRVADLPSADAEKKSSRFRISGSSLLAIAAILVGLVMGIGTLISMSNNSGVVGTQTVIRLTGTELLPDASALVTLSEAPAGVEVYLEFEQLGAAPENTFFQGWAQTNDGEQVPLGTFHLRRRQSSAKAFVALWAGVDLQELSEITVRLQSVGGAAEPSADVLLSGAVVPIG